MGRFFSFFYVSLVVFLQISSVAHAQTIKPKLQTAFQQFITDPSLESGLASFSVLNAKTGELVFEGNSKIGLPTASTLKVITSITALELLGPNYTFPTHLYYTGEIDSLGVLHGDIIIEGSGDPTLGSDRYPEHSSNVLLNTWKESIKKLGIKQINGKIIADDHLSNGFDVPGTWTWTDIGNYYGAGFSALNWKENKLGANFEPTKIGQTANLISTNADSSFQLINEVTTGAAGSGDQVYAYSAPYAHVIYFRGSYGLDLKKTIEYSMPDPAAKLIYDLSASLWQDSIQVLDALKTFKTLQDENPNYQIPKQKNLILTVQSPKLIDIIHWFNQKSINLYGEAILKVIGKISANKMESQEAANMMAKFWQNKLKIPISMMKVYDGSGLSPQNRVTSIAMAKIMQYARTRPWFTDFYKGLPTINGTAMKSGTITATLGYTGYQKAADSQEYTFSLLVNNYQGSSSTMRQNMFKLLNSLK
ncbi:D-alanyl-D-alanine carboxypeptidase/D-alanyl-D-alanine endopeptidase [Sphingobacterium sp. HJSM2_6]|uniref:D-alanyl-D-alanine carboxypeptidase/D-alanyl-D-alanine endopeptidase n=1 Tax=Sphingobacterium sp. HJSM2_6 TaxID=3366264 RepID=UPI003BC29CF6